MEISVKDRINLYLFLKNYPPKDIVEEMVLINLNDKIKLSSEEIEQINMRVNEESIIWEGDFNINIKLTKNEINLLEIVFEMSEDVTDDLFNIYKKLKWN